MGLSTASAVARWVCVISRGQVREPVGVSCPFVTPRITVRGRVTEPAECARWSRAEGSAGVCAVVGRAGAAGTVVRGTGYRAIGLRAAGLVLGLGCGAALGLALGGVLARAVGANGEPASETRQPKRSGEAAGPEPPRTSARRPSGYERHPGGSPARKSGDGRDRHTRRWTERRTTAGGRRSTIGPLVDYHAPGAAVGVRDGNRPTANGARSRPGNGRLAVGIPRFGPHRVGPYDVECVRAPFPKQFADREVSGLGRSVPRRAAAALVEGDEATTRRFHDILDELSRDATVGVAVGEDEKGGGETVAADVRHLPGNAALGGQAGGQRAAEKRATAIPFAVGAHQDHRFAGVRLPKATMVSGSRGAEIQAERSPHIGDGGGADPGVARRGVREKEPASGSAMKVGVASGTADESNTYASAVCCGFQGPAEVRVEVAVRQRLGTPRPGLFDQKPGPGGGCRSGEGFGGVEGSAGACAHEGEPNPELHARNAGRVERQATTSGGGVCGFRYSGVGHGGRRLRRRPVGARRRRPASAKPPVEQRKP